MTMATDPEFRVRVDPANPGQFFACCGLLELADRLCGGAEGWFEEGGRFCVRAKDDCSLTRVLQALKAAALAAVPEGSDAEEGGGDGDDDNAAEDAKAQPLILEVGDKPGPLRLDWWADKSLKPWAGSMSVRVIFRAMANAIDAASSDPLNDGQVVFDPETPGETGGKKARKGKKREPFYFDARRGANARSLDIGFVPDALKMTATAFPAVEALCLVGLERFRPRPTGTPRVFEYHTWSIPLDPVIASVVVCGELPQATQHTFRFENAFRTDQRKHKAFTAARLVTRRER